MSSRQAHARLERSGGHARLSDKQWRKIFDILGQPDKTVPSQSTVVPFPRSRRQYKKMFVPRLGHVGRRLRWHFEKLTIGFLIVAAVVIAQQVVEFGRGQLPSTPATATVSLAQQFTVADGDTVRVVGDAAGTRLVGFNTPEKFSPQCEHERQHLA